jgi:hypothetical protein
VTPAQGPLATQREKGRKLGNDGVVLAYKNLLPRATDFIEVDRDDVRGIVCRNIPSCVLLFGSRQHFTKTTVFD